MENTSSPTAIAAVVGYTSSVALPWTQIVSDFGVGPSAGDESHSSSSSGAVVVVESSDDNAGAGIKRSAWSKKPSPESEGAAGAGAVVMGAELWPALSESTVKASPKLTPSNSSLNLPDLGSNTAPQKTTISNVNHSYNASSNHGRPTRHKSMKRDGGGNAQANGGGFSHHQSPHNNHNHNFLKSSAAAGGSESFGRDNNMQNQGYRESGVRGDNPHPRGSFRRGNGGPHGSHQNFGGRRGDQDRGGSHDWNHQRNFNGRDAPLQQPRVSPRGYVRPSLGFAPFVHPVGPAPIRPYMNPMGIADMPMIYFPPGMPFIAPVPPPMYFPMPDPQLQAKIASQIDYYFSNENLIKDTYLRQNMDKDGWVAVSLVARFKKVMQLTDNIQLILDAVRSNSSVVEVKGDKIRRREDYMRWIMPSSVEFSTGSGLPSPNSANIVGLSAQIQSVSLDVNSPNATSTMPTGDSKNYSPATNDGPFSSRR